MLLGRHPHESHLASSLQAGPKLAGIAGTGGATGPLQLERRGLDSRSPRSRTTCEGLTTVRTFSPKESDITRQWHVIDATDVVLGRLASHVAVLLRGKHKPIFAPHVDTGDFVVVVNADKIALSGSKLQDKRAYRHSGYPGGLRSVSYGELMEKHPERAVEKAVRGMLPKNTLGRKTLSKLKVYAGPDHPHQAQQPKPYEIRQISQ